ncbi:hypothetical protein LTR86_008951 [Recurvomyces mirabilis]|nr:hypothetical protein LTR86_008951 [Recurvomyces mirabilis]
MPTTSQAFCEVCQKIFADLSFEEHQEPGDALEPFTQRQQYHETLEALHQALRANCPVCTQLAWRWNSAFQDSTYRIWRRFDKGTATVSYEFVPAQMVGPSIEETTWDTRPRTRIWAETADPGHLDGLAGEARRDARGDGINVMALARRWLERCISGHSGCASNTLPEQYPTRVLDVRSDDILLVESQTIRQRQPYATLSHVWGDRQFLVLTDANYHHFIGGLPLDEFPQTFQDVTRTSGQGAAKDKSTEIARMETVYADSHVNIGSSTSIGPFDGCFTEREKRYREPFLFTWRPDSSRDAETWCMYDQAEIKAHREFYNRLQLFTRGWVLQERLLCPRMLHLCKDRIHWECNHLRLASDMLPNGANMLGYPASTFPFSSSLQAQSEERGSLTSFELREKLSHYTEDKLVAIGGIAKRLARQAKSEYIAGMFRKSMVSQLNWNKDGFEVRQAEKWRAPSWSWAAMAGAIVWLAFKGPELASMISINTELYDPTNPFGRLRTCSLVLLGRLQKVEVGKKRPGVGERYAIRHDGDDIYVMFDHHEVCSMENMGELFLLPLQHVTDTRVARPGKGIVVITFMVVERTSASTYRRIGAWQDYPCDAAKFHKMMRRPPTVLVMV